MGKKEFGGVLFFGFCFFLLSLEKGGNCTVLTLRSDYHLPLSVYWDSAGSSPTAIGLVYLDQLISDQPKAFETHSGHVFVALDPTTMNFISLIQAPPADHSAVIDGVRQCGLFDDVKANKPWFGQLQCPVEVWNDYLHFIRVVIPLYEANQFVHPTSEIRDLRDKTESRRVWLNAEQPKLTPTFTKVGYETRQLPDVAWKPLKKFWEENRFKLELESLGQDNHHINHWESPTYMVWMPHELRSLLIKTISPILEEWIGGKTPLEHTSLYGIRVYKNNSYLLNHVDRSATHAVSAIIQIDQSVDEDWLLEMHSHEDGVENLKLSPGQIALYESASVVHGREKKLNGRYFANAFIHYRPKHNWDVASL